MSLFEKPEVIILKESSDARTYLGQLEELQKTVPNNTPLSQKIEKEITITKAGIIGEDKITFELKNSGMNLVVLHDIYIEDPNGNGAQIDFLVITPYVNVLIECKNLFGDIEINNRGDFIRTFEIGGRRHKEGIYSPITQNERHLRVFKECRKADRGFLSAALLDKGFEKYNVSLVVLANPRTVLNDRFAPAAIKRQVIRVDQLISVLQKMRSDLKTRKQDMLSFGQKILAMNIEERKDYFAKYEALKKEMDLQSATDSEEKPVLPIAAKVREPENATKKCPWCGSGLVLRTAKQGSNQGNQFWGCSAFPKCRYIENIK